MARIAGVDIPNEKRLDISLRYIYGIGPKSAATICERTGIEPATKARDLTDAELSRIRDLLEKEFLFRSPSDGVFFVNIRFMFNGDRLAFVKTYHLKDTPRQPDLFAPTLPAPKSSSDDGDQ